MKNEKDIQKELKDIAPLLSKLDKKERFVLPENYFENLQNDILAETKSNTAPASVNKHRGLLRYLSKSKYAAGLAAIILLTLTYYLSFYPADNESVTISLDDLSKEEISTYISANIDEFDDDLLMYFDDDEEINIFPLELNDAELDQSLDEIIEDIDIETLDNLF